MFELIYVCEENSYLSLKLLANSYELLESI